MAYEEYKVYGPYLREDGRKHVILIDKDKNRKTVSYPKYLIEKHYDIYLKENETVDHIDRDKTNDTIENLVIRERTEHIKLDAKRAIDITVNCIYCDKEFIIQGSKIRQRKRGKAGPFCSKSCSGKYGSGIQKHSINIIDKHLEIEPEYYYLEK